MITFFIFATVIVLIEWWYRPRLDITRDGWYVLWYGKKVRYYVKLFQRKKENE